MIFDAPDAFYTFRRFLSAATPSSPRQENSNRQSATGRGETSQVAGSTAYANVKGLLRIVPHFHV